MPLINTLRVGKGDKGFDPNANKGKGQGDDEEGGKEDNKPMETVASPPSFYYDDFEKWKLKFGKHIKERDFMKKQLGRTQEITCLTRNTNLKNNEDGLATVKKTGRMASFDPN